MVEDKPENGVGKPPETLSELEAAQRELRAFLDAHPNSAIEEVDGEKGKQLGVKSAWGEDAIVIYMPDDLGPMAEALNNVYLPERFTAIWHKDKNELEVIWTAFPLAARLDELKTRKFRFQYDGVEHECEFGPSSDRLLLIAEHAAPVAISDTGHRNLFSFHAYMRRQKTRDNSDTEEPLPGEPISFWIRNLEWDEDRVLHLAHHLNFYMTYYDSISPTILVHPPKTEAAKPRTRYIIGDFPQQFDGREIEDDLLLLWAASRQGDEGRRFGYCYRIIEYASYAYVEREARLQVRRLLAAPHALGDVSGLADRVIAATLSSKAEDAIRAEMLLKDAVNPDLLWREIDQNREAFIAEVNFDGGFKLAPLIGEGATQSSFAVNGISTFAHAARHIRNHLSHGRDRTTQASIMPTVGNFHKLAPWASAISVVAGEVINFKYIL